MAFASISSSSIAQKKPITPALMATVQANFTDQESRIRELERSASPAPTGSVFAYAGSSAPSGYLLCNGATVNRATYANLFAIIGESFGAGDGVSTFTLPNVQRRVLVGSGGSATATLGNEVGDTGGSETQSISASEAGPHTHTATTGNQSAHHTHGISVTTDAEGTHTHTVAYGADANTGSGVNMLQAGFGTTDTESGGNHSHVFSGTTTASTDHTHPVTTDAAGSGSAHNNVMPCLVLNFIVKT